MEWTLASIQRPLLHFDTSSSGEVQVDVSFQVHLEAGELPEGFELAVVLSEVDGRVDSTFLGFQPRQDGSGMFGPYLLALYESREGGDSVSRRVTGVANVGTSPLNNEQAIRFLVQCPNRLGPVDEPEVILTRMSLLRQRRPGSAGLLPGTVPLFMAEQVARQGTATSFAGGGGVVPTTDGLGELERWYAIVFLYPRGSEITHFLDAFMTNTLRPLELHWGDPSR
jgi:hypothetical protein